MVEDPCVVTEYSFDYIVITIKNPQKADNVREELKRLGIAEGRILWFDQTEFFWRFVQADCLLDE